MCVPASMAQELVKQWTGTSLTLESKAAPSTLHAQALAVRPRVTHESHPAFTSLAPAVQRNLLEAAALPSLAPDLFSRRLRASRATREVPAVPKRAASDDSALAHEPSTADAGLRPFSITSKVADGSAAPARPLSGDSGRDAEVRGSPGMLCLQTALWWPCGRACWGRPHLGWHARACSGRLLVRQGRCLQGAQRLSRQGAPRTSTASVPSSSTEVFRSSFLFKPAVLPGSQPNTTSPSLAEVQDECRS